jgi:sugar lactone lactonase YvrE
MKKISLSFLVVIILVICTTISCSKKSAAKPDNTTIPPTDTTKTDTTKNTTPPPPAIIDTVLVAGGSLGPAANELYLPFAVIVDNSGNIYIADSYNSRIQKWAPGATSGTTVAGGNGAGSGLDQLYYPTGICLDGAGNLYVADLNNNRILMFPAGSTQSTNGTIVAGGNGLGANADQLHAPQEVRIDPAGNLYVCDRGNNRIQKFPANSTSSTSGVTIAGGFGVGSNADQLNQPEGIFLDASGNIYVADNGNNRVQEFPSNTSYGTDGVTVAGGNSSGANSNQLNSPVDISVDASGNVYVTDTNNNRVQKWSPGATSGVTVAGSAAGTSGSTYNLLNSPTGIFLDAGAKNLYIADAENSRVMKWGLK